MLGGAHGPVPLRDINGVIIKRGVLECKRWGVAILNPVFSKDFIHIATHWHFSLNGNRAVKINNGILLLHILYPRIMAIATM